MNKDFKTQFIKYITKIQSFKDYFEEVNTKKLNFTLGLKDFTDNLLMSIIDKGE